MTLNKTDMCDYRALIETPGAPPNSPFVSGFTITIPSGQVERLLGDFAAALELTIQNIDQQYATKVVPLPETT